MHILREVPNADETIPTGGTEESSLSIQCGAGDFTVL
jgi:hypothetical protein